MNKTPLKFGTEGWRAIMADEFTFDNVKRVTQAVCNVLPSFSKEKLVLVGYDHRFFSKKFALVVAQVVSANKFRVELSKEPISSPALSFATKKRHAAIGIMITASHNPYPFNGFKLKGPHGGSVDEVVTKAVEAALDRIPYLWSNTEIKESNFLDDYLTSLKKCVSFPFFRRLKGTVVFDSMHGPGALLLKRVVGEHAHIVYERAEADPLFGGAAPEPVEKYLEGLKNRVIATKAIMGIAVDGDADRIGVVDDQGRYLPPQTVMPLLLLHLIENRKLKGKVLQTVSMGYLPQRIAHHFKLTFEEVPVGFKHIAHRMTQEKVVFGGEESGGYGVGLWSPERDGLLCTLLLMEMVSQNQKPLSFLVEDLYKRFGQSIFKRVDFSLPAPVDKPLWTQRILDDINLGQHGLKIKNINPIDGVKIHLDDDSWVLMRPSGTEPLIRTYSEGTTMQSVEQLLISAKRWAHLPSAEALKEAEADAKKKAKAKKNLKK